MKEKTSAPESIRRATLIFMNTKDLQASYLSASIDPHIEVIDLHNTHSVSSALDLLETELYNIAQKTDARYCRVIHGIGEGILKREVLLYVKKHPLVVDAKVDDHGGSTIVLF